jgi:pSer/pThr/pTyr-binding forkhead associated (FHA) protein
LLLLPAGPELGAGACTRRIATHHRTVPASPNSVRTTLSERSFGRLVYEDDAGDHTHEIVKDSVTIGRGGAAYFVDVRIASSPDVSREHARVRRDPATAECYLIDLSLLGTTLNGRTIPRGYDEVDGTKRENGAETRLRDRARIGLADTVFLEFRVQH